MESSSNFPQGENLHSQNAVSNQNDPGVTHDSGGDTGDSSLLWLPYFFLTIVLIAMTAGSFIKYHQRNKTRYKGKRYLSTNPEVYRKHRVTMNKDGTMPSPFSPQKVIADLPRSNTPDLTRSHTWNHSMHWNWPPNPRHEPVGKFENAGYFLDKLTERRKSRPFSYFNPGFVSSSPQINSNQSSFDKNPTSTGSSGSQFEQNSVRDYSESSGTEIELLQIQRTRSPPLPPKRNRYNINKYKACRYEEQPHQQHLQQRQQQQQQQQDYDPGELDSGYHSNQIGEYHREFVHRPFDGMNNNCDQNSDYQGNNAGHKHLRSKHVHGNHVKNNQGSHYGNQNLNISPVKDSYLLNRQVLTEDMSKIKLSYHGNTHGNNRCNMATMDINHHRDRAPLELTAENLILAHLHTLATSDQHVAKENTYHINNCK